MMDPLVKEWHSRDLNSRISEREVAAVVDWLATAKSFHVMRDHPSHIAKMKGCCFGMRIVEKSMQATVTPSEWKGTILG